jgi:hypothetical protein
MLAQRNGGVRVHKNMLVFLAADQARLVELSSAMRHHMAWSSISLRRDELNLDRFGITQTETRLSQAADTIRQRINETFIWLLVPHQTPTDREPMIAAVKINSQGTLAERVTRKVDRDTTVITAYGSSNLRLELDRIPLWRGDHVSVSQVWEDFTSHIYLPRLRDQSVLLRAVADGPRTLDMVRDGFGYADLFDEAEQRYRGLVVNAGVSAPVADGRTLLVRPEIALAQVARVQAESTLDSGASGGQIAGTGAAFATPSLSSKEAAKTQPTRYFGRKHLNVNRVGLNASEIANEVIAHLNALTDVDVVVTIEIAASGSGFDERIINIVSENAAALRFDANEFE